MCIRDRGYALPTVQPGLAWWPVLAVIVLLLMINVAANKACLLYTSDAADQRSSVDLGGRRII